MRFIKKLGLLLSLLLCSCSKELSEIHYVVNWFRFVSPTYVECYLRDGNSEIEWKGYIDKFITLPNSQHYWYEYSNGVHILVIGVK